MGRVKVDTTALLDCGATGNFVDLAFARRMKFPLERLKAPIRAFNVDGTHNNAGIIRYTTTLDLRIDGTQETRTFLILNCGKSNVILGMPWLTEVNPFVDWKTGLVSISTLPPEQPMPTRTREPPIHQQYLMRYLGLDPDRLVAQWWRERYAPKPKPVQIQKVTLSTEIAQFFKKEEVKLPPQYAQWKEVFDEPPDGELPPSRPFDHAIDLLPGFIPKIAKTYPLNPQESKACKDFIDEHLKSGKISPSKSPASLPVLLRL